MTKTCDRCDGLGSVEYYDDDMYPCYTECVECDSKGEINASLDVFKLVVPFAKEDWAPGVWAGGEGMKYVITKVDLENRVITLEVIK